MKDKILLRKALRIKILYKYSQKEVNNLFLLNDKFTVDKN